MYITYCVEFDVHIYGHGTELHTEEFSTLEEAKTFKEELLTEKGANKWIDDNYHDGYIELVYPDIYKKVITIETP